MAGGVAGKGSALVDVARARCTDALLALTEAQARGQVDGGTSNAAELALAVDPSVAAAIAALTAIT